MEKDSIGEVRTSDLKQSTDEYSTQIVSPLQGDCKADHPLANEDLPRSTTNLLL